MRTYFFNGLIPQRLDIQAATLDQAVNMVESRINGARLVIACEEILNQHEVMISSLSPPDQFGFQTSRFEGTFAVVTYAH